MCLTDDLLRCVYIDRDLTGDLHRHRDPLDVILEEREEATVQRPGNVSSRDR